MMGPETWRFVARFQFPPIVQGRQQGLSRRPDRGPGLLTEFVHPGQERPPFLGWHRANRVPVHRLMGRSPLRGLATEY